MAFQRQIHRDQARMRHAILGNISTDQVFISTTFDGFKLTKSAKDIQKSQKETWMGKNAED